VSLRKTVPVAIEHGLSPYLIPHLNFVYMKIWTRLDNVKRKAWLNSMMKMGNLRIIVSAALACT
jgi:hypothetical protein